MSVFSHQPEWKAPQLFSVNTCYRSDMFQFPSFASVILLVILKNTGGSSTDLTCAKIDGTGKLLIFHSSLQETFVLMQTQMKGHLCMTHKSRNPILPVLKSYHRTFNHTANSTVRLFSMNSKKCSSMELKFSCFSPQNAFQIEFTLFNKGPPLPSIKYCAAMWDFSVHSYAFDFFCTLTYHHFKIT